MADNNITADWFGTLGRCQIGAPPTLSRLFLNANNSDTMIRRILL